MRRRDAPRGAHACICERQHWGASSVSGRGPPDHAWHVTSGRRGQERSGESSMTVQQTARDGARKAMVRLQHLSSSSGIFSQRTGRRLYRADLGRRKRESKSRQPWRAERSRNRSSDGRGKGRPSWKKGGRRYARCTGLAERLRHAHHESTMAARICCSVARA